MSTSTPPDPLAAFRAEIAGMTVAELRQRFSGEFNTHRRILADAKAGRCIIHEGFRAFRDFLGHAGRQGERSRTLDRIDNADPEYGPGKVRWATPAEQANNRSTTRMVRGPDGTVRPVTEWAVIYRQKADTIRNRLDLGWREEEAVTGMRGVAPQPAGRAPDTYRDPQIVTPMTGMRSELTLPDEATDPWPEGMAASRYEPAYRLLVEHYPIRERALTRRCFAAWVLLRQMRRAESAVQADFPDYDAHEHDPEPPEALCRVQAYRDLLLLRRIYRDGGCRGLTAREMTVRAALQRSEGADFMQPTLVALGWARTKPKGGRRTSD